MTTKHLFDLGFQFESVEEMNTTISKEKQDKIWEMGRGQRKCIFHAGNSPALIVCDKQGRMKGFEEPVWLRGRTVSAKEINVCISEVLKNNPEIPDFEISFDVQMYVWYCLRDKLDGVDAEPTGDYTTVKVFEYKKTA